MLIETGYFVYSEGSAIDEAMGLYMGAIDHHAGVELKRRSAEKQSRKMLRDLQRAGYFRGVTISEAA